MFSSTKNQRQNPCIKGITLSSGYVIFVTHILDKVFFGHVLYGSLLRQRALDELCVFTCSSHRSQHPYFRKTVFKRTEYRKARRAFSTEICWMYVSATCYSRPRLYSCSYRHVYLSTFKTFAQNGFRFGRQTDIRLGNSTWSVRKLLSGLATERSRQGGANQKRNAMEGWGTYYYYNYYYTFGPSC